MILAYFIGKKNWQIAARFIGKKNWQIAARRRRRGRAVL
ncbi:hypothetical protein V1286_007321 [Bradyrhizobium algeriense]|uniref:Transposase n=1 Tax=Bradyrhizobium algeriense TaxID=634784 RepID=A0ABU8BNW2_9BRAD